MAALVISIFAIFCLLVMTEVVWHKKRVRPEVSRKFVHMVVGSFVAFWPHWPFNMKLSSVAIISVFFFLVVLISKYFNLFRSIHLVERRTQGELFYPVGIGLTALIAPNEWIFTAAILHLSLADGFAALLGSQIGATNMYKIAGQKKSIAGTLTFWIASAAIIIWYATAVPAVLAAPQLMLLLLPPVISLAENVSPYGLDNVTVPVLTAVLLRLF